MYNTLKYELKDGLAFVTVNRPESLNALNTEVLKELYECFDAIDKDPEVKAVVVTGEGRSFVAGADISEMVNLGQEEGAAMMAQGHKTMTRIESTSKAVIAAVNGFALGGGCELAMACDIRVASEKAIFGQPEVGLGIIPGFGGTVRMPKLVGKGMAKYVIMTNDKLNAQEALRIGLVEKVVAPEELLAEAERIARMTMAQGPFAIAQAKKAIDAEFDIELPAASEMEVKLIGECFATEDQTEGMKAFLEKRPAEFKNK